MLDSAIRCAAHCTLFQLYFLDGVLVLFGTVTGFSKVETVVSSFTGDLTFFFFFFSFLPLSPMTLNSLLEYGSIVNGCPGGFA
jgi:hypothetical protein